MKLLALIVAAAALSGCAASVGPGLPASAQTHASRTIRMGAPQITLRDPTNAARTWQVASAATKPGGVVVIGIDDIALSAADHRAIPGTLALAREAVAWRRTVIYLTTNVAASRVRADLARAGYPPGQVWTPRTAPWCGPFVSDVQFRASCITYEARRHDVILWLTRGRQLPTPADRTYAFAD